MALHSSKCRFAATIRFALLDVDGVCVQGTTAIQGSAWALGRLRQRVKAYRLITNQSQEACSSVMRKLQRLNFDVRPGEVFSALSAARALVEQQQLKPLCLLAPEAMEEFQDFPASEATAVVVGTSPQQMHYARLTEAMRVLLEKEGELIAVNKGRYFREAGEFQMMAGPFVAALEYATGKLARVVGKPSPDFFHCVASAAHGDAPYRADAVVMVGDDVRDDIQGAMDVGMQAILVRTGKYRPGDEKLCRTPPLAVVDCLADAVAFLEEKGLLEE